MKLYILFHKFCCRQNKKIIYFDKWFNETFDKQKYTPFNTENSKLNSVKTPCNNNILKILNISGNKSHSEKLLENTESVTISNEDNKKERIKESSPILFVKFYGDEDIPLFGFARK